MRCFGRLASLRHSRLARLARRAALAAPAAIAGVLGAPPKAAYALDGGKDFHHYVAESWTAERGLPESTIYALAQTSDGYLWVGMDEKLARFDGARFTIMEPAGKPFRRGIYRLYEDASHTLWIAERGGGLRRFANGAFVTVETRDGLPSGEITALTGEADGTVWVGTANGLARFRDGTWHAIAGRIGAVSALLVDRRGALWVGTKTELLKFVDDALMARFSAAEAIPGPITTLAADHGGTLWIGTEGGIARLANDAMTIHEGPKELTRTSVNALLVDHDDNLWIGSSTAWIARIRHGQITTQNEPIGIAALTEDREGNLWFGTLGHGLVHWHDGAFSTLTMKDGLSDNFVWSVMEDRSGAFWVGTFGHGLNRLNAGRVSRYDERNGLPNNFVWGTCEAPDGTIWIATGAGLASLRGEVLRTYSDEVNLRGSIARLMCEPDGSVWLVYPGVKVVHWQDGRARVLTVDSGAPRGDVWELRRTQQGILATSMSEGLYREREGRSRK